ncbi:ribonuclease G [Hathewaya proteolytica DSM 3090]|uniref:Ribonuclease G n=1 Tax=Hathewaya proteolytica DSM 3090 TaxID=1121331 RepID=A0A1M6JJE4_9CLOT|nr:ribonuclease E/G [Hathewaya proteolytica]SHJ46838.1 ribonuclease G [Hathewaya proteolytica DSM 3090]
MYTIYVEKTAEYLRIAEINMESDISRFYISENLSEPMVGSIYLGRIENEANLMGGYYVNIGSEKSCYLPKNKAHKAFKIGENLVVEILKEQIGNKGAVCTSKITIGGNLVVVSRGKGKKLFSKKIRKKEFRESYEDFYVDKNIDLVFRKNSEKASKEEVTLEYEKLLEKFHSVLRKEKYSLNVGLIYEGPGIVGEVFSEIHQGEEYNVIVNDKTVYEVIENKLLTLPKNIKKNINLKMDEVYPLFYKYNLENMILRFGNRRICLPSGAEIVVDRKEALTVIDINSGCHHGKSNHAVNMECAEFIPKIIMSRNLSGIIIVDFINTDTQLNKEEIVRTIKNGFYMDRNKVEVKEFNELSLLNITRERRGKSLFEHLNCRFENKLCSVNLLKAEYLMFLIKNRLIFEDYEAKDNITLEIPSIYESCFPEFIHDINEYIKSCGCKVSVEYNNSIEDFRILKNIE